MRLATGGWRLAVATGGGRLAGCGWRLAAGGSASRHALLGTGLVALAALAAAGCGGDPSGAEAGPAPPPRHPAMLSSDVQPATSSSGRLPAGHPPLPPGHPAPGSAGAASGSAAGAAGAPPVAPAPPASAPPGQAAAGGEVVAGPVALQVPEGWVRKPNPAFVLAEFALPRAEGDPEDGRVTVSSAGGPLDMNINRWRGQFRENPPAETTAREVNGFKATVVRLSGTLSGSGGPMARGGPDKPGQRMWGAIIEVPGQEQKVFLKATGPEKTLARWEESLGKALAGVKRAAP